MICFTLSAKDFYDFLRRARAHSRRKIKVLRFVLCVDDFISRRRRVRFDERERPRTVRESCLPFTCVHTINNSAAENKHSAVKNYFRERQTEGNLERSCGPKQFRKV